MRGAHARKLTPRHRRTASNPGKSPLYPLSFSLSRALTRLRDFFFSRDFLRFAFTHQKIPAPAADRDRTSPVHSPARVQAATCLSQLAHPSADDQLERKRCSHSSNEKAPVLSLSPQCLPSHTATPEQRFPQQNFFFHSNSCWSEPRCGKNPTPIPHQCCGCGAQVWENSSHG